MTTTANRAKPGEESRTTSTTGPAHWKAVPVLRAGAAPCGKEPGEDDLLDSKDTRALRRHAERIAQLCDSTNRTMTKAIVEIGAELSAAQALLAGLGREGRFRPWCKRQGFAMSTVYRAIAAHEAFGKCPTLGHFDLQAVYVLSANSCPEAATAEAMRLADKGDHIDGKRAREIVAEHVPEDTRSGKRRSCESAVTQDSKSLPDRKRLTCSPEAELAAGEDPETTCRDEAAAAEGHAPEHDGPAVGTSDLGTAGSEQAGGTEGLVGLQAVIAALESLGVYDDYREVLERIRLELERNSASEENREWTL